MILYENKQTVFLISLNGFSFFSSHVSLLKRRIRSVLLSQRLKNRLWWNIARALNLLKSTVTFIITKWENSELTKATTLKEVTKLWRTQKNLHRSRKHFWESVQRDTTSEKNSFTNLKAFVTQHIVVGFNFTGAIWVLSRSKVSYNTTPPFLVIRDEKACCHYSQNGYIFF